MSTGTQLTQLQDCSYNRPWGEGHSGTVPGGRPWLPTRMKWPEVLYAGFVLPALVCNYWLKRGKLPSTNANPHQSATGPPWLPQGRDAPQAVPPTVCVRLNIIPELSFCLESSFFFPFKNSQIPIKHILPKGAFSSQNILGLFTP